MTEEIAFSSNPFSWIPYRGEDDEGNLINTVIIGEVNFDEFAYLRNSSPGGYRPVSPRRLIEVHSEHENYRLRRLMRDYDFDDEILRF